MGSGSPLDEWRFLVGEWKVFLPKKNLREKSGYGFRNG